MIGYVYDIDTMELIATIEGQNERQIEAAFNYDTDTRALSYTPAFGCNDGIVLTNEIEKMYSEVFDY